MCVVYDLLRSILERNRQVNLVSTYMLWQVFVLAHRCKSGNLSRHGYGGSMPPSSKHCLACHTLQHTPALPQSNTACCFRSRYRGQGTNLSKVSEHKQHQQDTGSPQVQIAQLTARVDQLTGHLQTHKKDYASRRGLLAVLSNRKSLMQYLLKKDRYVAAKYCLCFI